MPRLEARNISVGYGDKMVLSHLGVEIPDGEFTVIVGPNACGKSTLLKSLARLTTASTGEVLLDGADIRSYPSKQVAQQISLLPQNPIAPDGIVVEDLVSRGRYPYHTMMRQWSSQDQQALEWAMERANVAQLKDRPVAALSGGQRQRVWLAMVLAQQTPIVLLDEPTTFLDITHQVEVLDLAAGLYEAGSTVVAVLHELTLAFRYATHVIVMKAGEIVAQGSVKDAVTAQLLEEVYEIACDVIADPRTGKPIVIPRTSRFRRAAATTPSA